MNLLREWVWDWRAWFVAAMLAGYLIVWLLAWREPAPMPSPEEIDRLIEYHVERCDLMENEWSGYACDT
jgi:predicted MFS family arabinose efflux permease